MIGAFLGGIGLVLRWNAVYSFIYDSGKGRDDKIKDFGIKSIKYLNNISLIIGFPIAGVIL